MILWNTYFAFEKSRYYFIVFGDGAVLTENTILRFKTSDAQVELFSNVSNTAANALYVTSTVQQFELYDGFGDFGDPDQQAIDNTIPLQGNVRYYDAQGNIGDWAYHPMLFTPGPQWHDDWVDSSTIQARIEASREVGPVHQSKVRVSQHLCAPLINPNRRIGCSAPLNFDSSHLPPEMRDFRIVCRDVKFDFLPGSCELEALTLYEFDGGNQIPTEDSSLLHLPQFRHDSIVTEDGTFDLEVFSPYGMPCYITVYARHTDFGRDGQDQPLITQLSIRSATTMKKSDVILDSDAHELYHLTQRNVHPRACYDRDAFRDRQVVLLSAEDCGMMGLSEAEYQHEKRAKFIFSGTVNNSSTVNVLMIYTNRGLLIDGRHISVLRLK